MRLPLVGLLLLTASALLGCTDILGSDPSTGLQVTVRKGPIEPVSRDGEDNSVPVDEAVVLIEGVDGGSVRLSTGPTGLVRALLVPGDYIVTVKECPGAMGLPAPEPATVTSGSMVDVYLECDTGIR